MASTFLFVPPPGSAFWQDAVPSVGALPAAGEVIGEVINVIGTGLYYWSGAAWIAMPSPGSVPSTRNINTTAPLTGGGNLSADLTLGITQSGVATNGYLSSADWNTFNNKEPAIAAGTTAQYFRGDKTFQILNTDALQTITSGVDPGAGHLGETIASTVAVNTTTGVGVTGMYGNVTSVVLTAGRWALQGTAGFNENGATLTTGLQCGISAATDGTGISEFDTTLAPFLISSTSDALLVTPMVIVNIAAGATYYLNTKFSYTSGTPKHRGRLRAVRIN